MQKVIMLRQLLYHEVSKEAISDYYILKVEFTSFELVNPLKHTRDLQIHKFSTCKATQALR